MAKTDEIRDYYDTFAQIYEDKHGLTQFGQVYNFRKYYEPFLNRTVPAEGKLLELGCGTGVYTRWFVERGLDVVAMDISGAMIDQARGAASKARFVEGNCENPGSAVGEDFDVIVGINSFSYYVDKRSALRNYHRLLRDGGRFVTIDMNGTSPLYDIMSMMGKNEMGRWLNEVRESNKGMLSSMLEETGYNLEALERFAFIPNGLGKGMVSLLAPFDRILHAMPFTGPLAMRVAVAAIKIG